MSTVSAQDRLVLVLSREMLEAADVADYAISRALGEVIVEKNVGMARRLVTKNHFSYAFVGVPSCGDRTLLLNALTERRTRTVLIGGDPCHVAEHAEIRILSRPFTDRDLDIAITQNRNP